MAVVLHVQLIIVILKYYRLGAIHCSSKSLLTTILHSILIGLLIKTQKDISQK